MVSQQSDYAMNGEFMREMRNLYLEDVDEKIAGLRGFVEGIRKEPSSPEILEEGHLLTHRLAGTAASYGFPFPSEVGRTMEEAVEAAIQGSGSLDERTIVYFERLLQILDEYFQEAKGGEIPPERPLPVP